MNTPRSRNSIGNTHPAIETPEQGQPAMASLSWDRCEQYLISGLARHQRVSGSGGEADVNRTDDEFRV